MIPWTAALQASLSITTSRSLLKLMSIKSVMPSNHLILCCPLLLPPSIFPSIRVFSNESVLRLEWPKYWNFNFSISPYNEYSGLISFRIGWISLQATLYTTIMKPSLFLPVTLPFLIKRLSELMIGKYIELSLSLQFCAFFPPKSPCYSFALFLLLRYREGIKKATTIFWLPAMFLLPYQMLSLCYLVSMTLKH